jgi:hypothetical protein
MMKICALTRVPCGGILATWRQRDDRFRRDLFGDQPRVSGLVCEVVVGRELGVRMSRVDWIAMGLLLLLFLRQPRKQPQHTPLFWDTPKGAEDSPIPSAPPPSEDVA